MQSLFFTVREVFSNRWVNEKAILPLGQPFGCQLHSQGGLRGNIHIKTKKFAFFANVYKISLDLCDYIW